MGFENEGFNIPEKQKDGLDVAVIKKIEELELKLNGFARADIVRLVKSGAFDSLTSEQIHKIGQGESIEINGKRFDIGTNLEAGPGIENFLIEMKTMDSKTKDFTIKSLEDYLEEDGFYEKFPDYKKF
jgi:hypothetical protein